MPGKRELKQRGVVHEFAKETGVFGLNMMHPRVSTPEQLIWLLATLFFFAYTANDLYHLTQGYLDQNLLTLVEARSNDSIIFNPPPTIRFQLHKDFIAPNDTLSPVRLTEMLQHFKAAHINIMAEKLIQETAEMKELVRLNLGLLQHISGEERASIWNYGESGVNSSFIKHQTLYSFYESQNVSLMDVKRVTGAYLCTELRVSITRPNGKTLLNVCNANYISEVLIDGFSMTTAYRPGQIEFTSWMQTLSIDYLSSAVNSAVFDLGGGDDFFQIGLSDAPINVSSAEAQTVTITARPIAVFHRARTTKHPCTYESPFDCTSRCIAEQIVKCANCWPIAIPLRHSLAQMTICPHGHVTQNSTSLDLHNFFEVLAKCRADGTRLYGFMDKCRPDCFGVPQCEVRTFGYSKETARSANPMWSSIRLAVQSFSFPAFEERVALEWQDFVAQIGGSIGLYLGLSLAALLHFPVFLARQAISLVCKRWSNGQTGVVVSAKSIEMEWSQRGNPAVELSRAGEERSTRMRAVEKMLDAHSVQLNAISKALGLPVEDRSNSVGLPREAEAIGAFRLPRITVSRSS